MKIRYLTAASICWLLSVIGISINTIASGIYILILYAISGGLWIYILLELKKLLKLHFNYSGIHKLINACIILDILNITGTTILEILPEKYRSACDYSDNVVLVFAQLLYFIIFLKLIRLRTDLKEIKLLWKAFCITEIIYGVAGALFIGCFIFLHEYLEFLDFSAYISGLLGTFLAGFVFFRFRKQPAALVEGVA